MLQQIIRGLFKARGWMALVHVTLALSIGATTAIFGVVDALLLKPLPYPGAERLREIRTFQEAQGRAIPGVSGAGFHALRATPRAFSVEGYQFGAATLTGQGEPAIVGAPRVTPGLLQLLQVRPLAGRLFTEDEGQSAQPVALVSERVWAARFGRSDDVVGRRVLIDDVSHAIVGVLPSSFGFPDRGTDVWRPVAVNAKGVIAGRVQVVASMPAGMTGPAFDAVLSALSNGLREGGRLPAGQRLIADELVQARFGRNHRSALYALGGAVTLVLLVACVNVTNLLVMRAMSRRDEFALMKALGADRVRLFAYVLGEALMLVVPAVISAMFLAQLILHTIVGLLPEPLTMMATAEGLDWRALGFGVLLSAVVCLGISVLPALRVMRVPAIRELKTRTVGSADRHGEWWQSALVTAQLGLVLLLLTSTGLLLRSFVRLINVEPGFDARDLVAIDLQLPAGRYGQPGSGLALVQQFDSLLENHFGAGHATYAGGAPPRGGGFSFDIRPEAEGQPLVRAEGLELPHTNVAADYFSVMGVPLREGRTFASDDTPDVIVVNDVLARRFWPGQSPLGRRFRLSPTEPWRTVIGVAGDVRQMGLADPMGDGMELYSRYVPENRDDVFAVIVRGEGDAQTVARQMKQHLWRLDPNLPVVSASSMEERMAESVAQSRMLVDLALAFAAVAVLLASIGVYGTSAYWVQKRRRDLGIRMALGADRPAILRLVFSQGLRVAAWGSVLGIAASLAVTRLMRALLFETDPGDPVVLVATTSALLAIVCAACLGPALQASNADPAVTLRAE